MALPTARPSFAALVGALLLTAAAPPAGSRYVSMGSSYAAGPGVGLPAGDGHGCARSRSNYAQLFAKRRGLDLVDVACSGDSTGDVLNATRTKQAQIDAVTPDTALVTMTIGGNDVGYVSTLNALACRAAGGSCQVETVADQEHRLAQLDGRLEQIVAGIRQRAPAARIVMIGYMPAVPERGPPTCAAVPFPPADALRMRTFAEHLAQHFAAVAARTKVAIVRSYGWGGGHDACSSEPYISGANAPRNPAWPDAVHWHPTDAGMAWIADRLSEVVPR